MAFESGDVIEVSLKHSYDWGLAYNVYQYNIWSITGTQTAEEIGEAWWNHVKNDLRAMQQVMSKRVFVSALVRDLIDPAGDYGEFAIPAESMDGTRASALLGGASPGFVAAGVRFTVSSRATRPGQKRWPYLTEADVNYDEVVSGFQTLMNTAATTLTGEMTLGDPAIGVVLRPVVVKKSGTGAYVSHQPVTGFVINPYATSQVSRKRGRGI